MKMADTMLRFEQTQPAKGLARKSGMEKSFSSADAPNRSGFRDVMEKKSAVKPAVAEQEASVTEQEGTIPGQGTDPVCIRLQQELAAALTGQPEMPQNVVTFVPAEVQAAAAFSQGAAALETPHMGLEQVLPEQSDSRLLAGQPLNGQEKAVSGETQSAFLETANSAQTQVTAPSDAGKPNSGDLAQEGAGQKTGDEWELHASAEQGPQPLFENPETAPVKVGEGAQLDTGEGNFEKNLAGELSHALKKGDQKLTIQLSPRSLGSVTVEMTRTQDGALHVLLRGATVKATEILNEHAAGLGQLLQGNLQGPVQVEVSRQDDGHGYQQQYQDSPGSGGGRGQQQQERHPSQNQQDFLQRLRLGLITPDAEAV